MRERLPLLVLTAILAACDGMIGSGPEPPDLLPDADVSRDGGLPDLDAGPSDGEAPSAPCALRSTRPAPAQRWTPAGPPGGFAQAMLPLPDGSLLVGTGRAVGAAGAFGRRAGLYRSTDDGVHFARVLDLGASSVTSLVATSTAIFAAVQGGELSSTATVGVLLSTDGGRQFIRANDGLHAGARVRRLSAGPGTNERVFALVDGLPSDPGVDVSTLYRKDSGGAWVRLSAAGLDPNPGGPVRAMVADPFDRERIYVADGARFYSSEDAGESFVAVDLGAVFAPSGLRQIRGLHADPNVDGHLYLATADDGLYESMDHGATWQKIASTGGLGINGVAFADSAIYLATSGGGLLVSQGGGFSPTGECIIDRVLTAVAVSSSHTIHIGTYGGGVLSAESTSLRFAPQAEGIDELVANVVVTGTAGQQNTWLLSGAGLFRLDSPASTWERYGETASTISFSDIVQDPSDPDRFLLSTHEDLYEGGGTGVGVLALSVTTRETERAAGIASRNVGALVFASQERVFAYQLRGQSDSPNDIALRLLMSNDGGRSFSDTPMQSFDTYPLYPYVFPASPLAVAATGTVYAGALVDEGNGTFSRALVRSEDGVQFEELWSDRDDPDFRKHMNGVYADHRGRIYLAGWHRGASLWRSSGGAFSPFVEGLPSETGSVIDVAFGPDDQIAVATDVGIFLSRDGASFEDFSGGVEGPSGVVSLAFAPGPVLIVTTVERSVLWRAVD